MQRAENQQDGNLKLATNPRSGTVKYRQTRMNSGPATRKLAKLAIL